MNVTMVIGRYVNINNVGDCYGENDASALILESSCPHNRLDCVSGTYTPDALELAVNHTFPQKRDIDVLLVVMLTHGLPQSVTGESSQITLVYLMQDL